MRRVFLLGMLLSLVFFMGACLDTETQPRESVTQKLPNIVLIIADDHGTDAIGAYGNTVIKTPHLDALAREGTRFTHAFATASSCSSSRAVILTGQHSHANGMYGLQHKHHHFQSFDTIKALPSILHDEANYRTARIGKYHLAPESVYSFDEVLSKGAANDMKSVARSPVEMANMSKAFIAPKDQPFFLYFATDDPHRAFPFNTSPAPNSFGNRPEGYPGVKEVIYSPQDVIVPPFLPDTQAVRLELAQYYQSISRLDQGVGALIDVLKQTGQYDNTIIIYLSDNGIAFPGAKTNLYDPGIRLPLIVRVPNQSKQGQIHNGLVSWTDIAPTILDYAGVQLDGDVFQGVSFKPMLDGQTVSVRTELYASHSLHEIQMYYPMRMVRTKKYKLIHNLAYPLAYPNARDLYESLTWQDFLKSGEVVYGQRKTDKFTKRPEYELYDLENDPGEVNNLAGYEETGIVQAKLQAQLLEFQKTTNDPWYLEWYK